MTDRDRLIELINQGDKKCGEQKQNLKRGATMPKYIDITELSKQIADFKKAINSPNSDYMTGYVCALTVTEGIIADTLTADVVKVVRCKECKHAYINSFSAQSGIALCKFLSNRGSCTITVQQDDYCSYGELKERDQNAR